MSRPEGRFTAGQDAVLDAAELLAALEAQMKVTAGDRQEAIACYLSTGDGWRDALQLLGGAFADNAESPGLKGDKAE